MIIRIELEKMGSNRKNLGVGEKYVGSGLEMRSLMSETDSIIILLQYKQWAFEKKIRQIYQ